MSLSQNISKALLDKDVKSAAAHTLGRYRWFCRDAHLYHFEAGSEQFRNRADEFLKLVENPQSTVDKLRESQKGMVALVLDVESDFRVLVAEENEKGTYFGLEDYDAMNQATHNCMGCFEDFIDSSRRIIDLIESKLNLLSADKSI